MIPLSFSALALCALATFGWLVYRIGKGSVSLLFGTSGLAMNIVGAWLIAIGFTGRSFPALEASHGAELFFHVLFLNSLFLLGALVTNAGWDASWNHRRSRRSSQLYTPALRSEMVVLGLVGVITLANYLRKLAANPLAAAFSFEYDDKQLALLRNSATADFGGHYWRYNLMLSFLLPLASWYFLCRLFSKDRGYRLDAGIFVLLFLTSVYGAAISLQKFPLLIYLLLTGLIYLEAKGTQLRIAHIAVFAVVLAALVSIMYGVFAGSGETIGGRLILGVNRMFVGQVYPALAYLELFPDHIRYLLGRSFPNPGGILPFVPFDFTYVGWTYLYPHHPRLLYGTANTMYFMEWYVNFGYLGMYIIAPVTGSLVMLVKRSVDTIETSDLRIPVSYLFAGIVFRLALTSFSQVFEEGVFVICIVSILKLGASMRRVPLHFRSNGA